MPIDEWLRDCADLALGPEEIEQINAAYERVLNDLGLVKRRDAVNEIVATKILEVVQAGERDATKIASRALAALGRVFKVAS